MNKDATHESPQEAPMKFRRITCTFLAIVLTASLALAAELTKEPLTTVKKNVDEKKAVLVDVREKSEWDEGHVKDAIFLPLSGLKGKVDEEAIKKKLPKDKIIYTHCVAGVRCVSAGNVLEKLGYEVRCLKPGYKQLIDAGFEPAKE
jgi:rhodanese-related sulfurtransferase